MRMRQERVTRSLLDEICRRGPNLYITSNLQEYILKYLPTQYEFSVWALIPGLLVREGLDIDLCAAHFTRQ